MERSSAASRVFRFGLFRADTLLGTLTRNGSPVKLQDQPFRALVMLLERPGELVTREQLREQLWPPGTYVDFEGSLNAVFKRLRAALGDDSDNPRFIETIPRRGYRFIAPVSMETLVKPGASLQEAPASSEDVAVVSKPSPAPASAATHAEPAPIAPVVGSRSAAVPVLSPIPERARSLRLVGLGAILGVAVLLAFGLSRGRAGTGTKASVRPTALPPAALRKSVAVLGLQNSSGRADDEWLGTACAEMLSTELALGDRLRIVSGEDVARLRIASPWPATGTLSPETTGRIGLALGGDVLLLGSYTAVGSGEKRQLRLDARLQNARTGEILAEAAESGDGQELFPLVSRLGSKLRERLGVPSIADTDAHLVLATLPSGREAARLYSLGLARLRERDALAARDLLEGATRLEPTFPLGHAMLARAWGQLGFEQRRREEARKAWELCSRLSQVDRLLVEGDYYDSLGNHAKAASAYRTLFELYPDRVDFGLQLVGAEAAAGQETAALETLRRLRRLPPPASGDPLIDLAESNIVSTHNLPSALALLQSGKRKAMERGLRNVYGQILKRECLGVIYSEHPEPADAACREAYEVFLAAGNRLEAADALRMMADRLGSQGKFREAIAQYERALVILRDLGEEEKTGAALNNMAINYTNMGDFDRAEELYRQAQARFQKAGDLDNVATALCNVADIAFVRGRLAAAAKLYRQAIDTEPGSDPSLTAYPVYRLADVLLEQGRVEEARSGAARAVAAYRPLKGSYQYLTGAMMVLGDVLRAEGDLVGARKQYEESLSLREKTGAEGLVAESQTSLAALALDEGHPDQAEPLLRRAIEQFEKESGGPDAAGAYVLLSRSLLMEGKRDEARAAVQHAMELSRKSPDPELRIPAAVQAAKVESSGRSSASAIANVRAAAAEARRLGYYGLECEARLILGELVLRDSPQSGRVALEGLEKEARERGLGLIARKAETLLRQSSSS